jgi:hypothetical protein
MEINYVFPHAIATVDMNALVDNKKIHDTIEEHAIGVPEETGARVWDCKVKTSFENDELSMKFAVEHVDFLKAVNEQVNQYMVEVGWYEPGKPNKVTQCWWNKYDEGHHFQEAHHHGVHEVCAVYYVTNDTIPTLFTNPNYYACQSHYDNTPGREMTVNKRHFEVYAQAGHLVIFPGYMVHAVPYIRKGKYQDRDLQQKNRITIAMNFHKYEEDLITRVENDDGKRYIRPK